MKALVLAALFAATLARADGAPPLVTVDATATPDDTTIGTPIRYEVTVSAPPGVEVAVAQPAERIDEFEILDFGTEAPAKTADGRVVFRRWWKLVTWSTGNQLLHSPRVQYRAPDGTLADAPGDDVGVTVQSLLARAAETADIRDIKPPEPIPVDWRPYWAIGGATALLVLAAVGLWLLRRRRARPVAVAPALPPHVVARDALQALRARALVQQGAFKEYYSALSDIVRRYLEDGFAVRAPEMTTEEFLVVAARARGLAPLHRRLLAEFLLESDLVKFARHVPSIADSDRAFDAARRFVDETAASTPEEAA